MKLEKDKVRMPDLPSISVAVINYNGEKTLTPTLNSVFSLAQIKLTSVILIDNASTDRSLDLVKRDFPDIVVHRLLENRGPNPARNRGLRCSNNDYVLIMDNDIVLGADYVSRLITVFYDDPSAGAASGQIRLYHDQQTVQYAGTDIHYVGEIKLNRKNSIQPIRVGCVSAGAALFDRRKVFKVGEFDEDFFFGWEDGDLTFRLSLAGHPCYVLSTAICYHMQRKRELKWVRYQARNRWWFILKNYDLRTIILAFPAILAFQACACLFFLMKGKSGAYLKGWIEAWTSLPAIRRKRKYVQNLKVLADVDLLHGDRFDLPLGTSGRFGRLAILALNKVFYIYWLMIRPFLRHKARKSSAA